MHFWFVSLDYSILAHLLSSLRMLKSLYSQLSDAGMLGVNGQIEETEMYIMGVSWGSRFGVGTWGCGWTGKQIVPLTLLPEPIKHNSSTRCGCHA